MAGPTPPEDPFRPGLVLALEAKAADRLFVELGRQFAVLMRAAELARDTR